MKTWCIGLALLAFLVSHTAFTYSLQYVTMTDICKSNWRSYNWAGVTSSLFVFIMTGQMTFIQKQFIGVMLIVLIFTFVITILTNSLLISKPYPLMKIVDAGTALAVTVILTTFGKHGYFNEDAK